jgi:TolB-like protein/DNA-binding CsgD family transcriptional regulator/Tfp pilus assembly protein PilF
MARMRIDANSLRGSDRLMPSSELPSLSQLTRRQREVFELLAKGLSNPEIGAALGIGVATVKTHVTRIYDLLDVSTRAEAAGLYGGALNADAHDDAQVPGFGLCPAIAVMPFENLGETGANDPLCRGLVEDLIQRLSWWRLFPVLSRSSTWAYAGQSWDLRSVGRELGVAYCVEGTVRRARDRYQLNVNLVDTRNGNLVWSDRFEASSREMIELQEEISQKVAAALFPNLIRAEVERHNTIETEQLDAWQASLRGLWTIDRMQSTSDINHQAIEYFDHAISADPSFVLPHYGKVLAYNQRLANAWDIDPSIAIESLFESAVKSDHVDPMDPRTLCANGISLALQGDKTASAAHFSRAIEMNPSDVASLHFSALLLGINRIDSQQAIQNARRAVRLARRSPLRAAYLNTLGLAHLIAGDEEDAIEAIDESVRLAPSSYGLIVFQAIARASIGDLAATRTSVGRLRELRPELPEPLVKAFLFATAGPLIETAEPTLAELDFGA